jgi:hypothetical protein
MSDRQSNLDVGLVISSGQNRHASNRDRQLASMALTVLTAAARSA